MVIVCSREEAFARQQDVQMQTNCKPLKLLNAGRKMFCFVNERNTSICKQQFIFEG